MPRPRRADFQEPLTTRLVVADERIALCGRLDDIGRHAHAAPAVVIGVGIRAL